MALGCAPRWARRCSDGPLRCPTRIATLAAGATAGPGCSTRMLNTPFLPRASVGFGQDLIATF